jgi:hypothetical protein
MVNLTNSTRYLKVSDRFRISWYLKFLTLKKPKKSPHALFVSQFYGLADSNVNPPVVNRQYTSSNGYIYLSSFLGKDDWFQCNWTTTPKPNTTDVKCDKNQKFSNL